MLANIMEKRQKGFTLLELIVVMAILVVLAGLVVPRYYDVLSSSREKAHKANVKMIQDALELYALNTNTPLDEIDDIEVLETNEYLKEIPENPTEGDEYTVRDGKVYPGVQVEN